MTLGKPCQEKKTYLALSHVHTPGPAGPIAGPGGHRLSLVWVEVDGAGASPLLVGLRLVDLGLGGWGGLALSA